ncbi:hypothetical protein L1049_014018 [Liquidambar formosana]|uniref:PH domain-containing protein n=1 Tax=Liquidambar formosana TaxID=63359 RepID=A0AAP0WZ90_LIQFO
MDSLWRAATGADPKPEDYDYTEFWSNPERTGWLTKQGEYIKTWRRRWFVLKQGKLFWFKDSTVNRTSKPRGFIPVGTCLTCQGRRGHPQQAVRFRALHQPRHHVLYCRFGEGEGGVDQLHRTVHSAALPIRYRFGSRRLR